MSNKMRIQIDAKKVFTNYTPELRDYLKETGLSSKIGSFGNIAKFVSLDADGEIYAYSSISWDEARIVTTEEFIRLLEALK